MIYYRSKTDDKKIVAYDPETKVVFEFEEISIHAGRLAGVELLINSAPQNTKKPTRGAKKYGKSCKVCGEPGHMAKTCSKQGTARLEDIHEPESPPERITERLTPTKLAKIKQMLGEGDPQSYIATDVGVSEETVERIAVSLGI